MLLLPVRQKPPGAVWTQLPLLLLPVVGLLPGLLRADEELAGMGMARPPAETTAGAQDPTASAPAAEWAFGRRPPAPLLLAAPRIAIEIEIADISEEAAPFPPVPVPEMAGKKPAGVPRRPLPPLPLAASHSHSRRREAATLTASSLGRGGSRCPRRSHWCPLPVQDPPRVPSRSSQRSVRDRTTM